MAQKTGVMDSGAVELGRFQKSVAGSANVTLVSSEYENGNIELTGALTGSIQLILPVLDGREWRILNSTTGNFTVTAIGATGTGIVLLRLTETKLRCDGTNIIRGGSSVTSDGVPLAQVADANVSPGMPVLHRIDVAAGATGNVDVVLTYKTRVVNAWLVKKSAAGGGAGTIQVLNSGNAITDAMSIDVADKTVVRCGTIDDAFWEIAAGGTLRVTRTRSASTDETCTVFVEGVLVA